MHPILVMMGIGHSFKQQSFSKINGQHRFQAGGVLRNKRKGRKQRPLSTKHPIHIVFKINKTCLKSRSLRAPKVFSLVLKIIEKYALDFAIKVEQLSIQNDHIHILVRMSRRAHIQNFFRVVPGQIAQISLIRGLMHESDERVSGVTVTDTPKLWKYRPFTRVVIG